LKFNTDTVTEFSEAESNGSLRLQHL